MISLTHAQTPAQRLFDLLRLIRLAARNWLTVNAKYDYWTAEAINVM